VTFFPLRLSRNLTIFILPLFFRLLPSGEKTPFAMRFKLFSKSAPFRTERKLKQFIVAAEEKCFYNYTTKTMTRTRTQTSIYCDKSANHLMRENIEADVRTKGTSGCSLVHRINLDFFLGDLDDREMRMNHKFKLRTHCSFATVSSSQQAHDDAVGLADSD
jgi:hypothetical protein